MLVSKLARRLGHIEHGLIQLLIEVLLWVVMSEGAINLDAFAPFWRVLLRVLIPAMQRGGLSELKFAWSVEVPHLGCKVFLVDPRSLDRVFA